MKKTILLSAAILAISCGDSRRHPEAIDGDGMTRDDSIERYQQSHDATVPGDTALGGESTDALLEDRPEATTAGDSSAGKRASKSTTGSNNR